MAVRQAQLARRAFQQQVVVPGAYASERQHASLFSFLNQQHRPPITRAPPWAGQRDRCARPSGSRRADRSRTKLPRTRRSQGARAALPRRAHQATRYSSAIALHQRHRRHVVDGRHAGRRSTGPSTTARLMVGQRANVGRFGGSASGVDAMALQRRPQEVRRHARQAVSVDKVGHAPASTTICFVVGLRVGLLRRQEARCRPFRSAPSDSRAPASRRRCPPSTRQPIVETADLAHHDELLCRRMAARTTADADQAIDASVDALARVFGTGRRRNHRAAEAVHPRSTTRPGRPRQVMTQRKVAARRRQVGLETG